MVESSEYRMFMLTFPFSSAVDVHRAGRHHDGDHVLGRPAGPGWWRPLDQARGGLLYHDLCFNIVDAFECWSRLKRYALLC